MQSAFYEIVWKTRNELIARRIEACRDDTPDRTPDTILRPCPHTPERHVPAKRKSNSTTRSPQQQQDHALTGTIKRIRLKLTIQRSNAQQEATEVTIPFDPGGEPVEVTHRTHPSVFTQPLIKEPHPIQNAYTHPNRWYIVQPDPMQNPSRILIRDIHRVYRKDYNAIYEPELYRPIHCEPTTME